MLRWVASFSSLTWVDFDLKAFKLCPRERDVQGQEVCSEMRT